MAQYTNIHFYRSYLLTWSSWWCEKKICLCALDCLIFLFRSKTILRYLNLLTWSKYFSSTLIRRPLWSFSIYNAVANSRLSCLCVSYLKSSSSSKASSKILNGVMNKISVEKGGGYGETEHWLWLWIID